MHPLRNLLASGLLWGCTLAASAAEPPLGLPSPVLPDGLGVNIHFTNPRPGEMEMLAAGGFRWVRMDFGWAGTERRRGQYDFQAYDQLLSALDRHHLRAVLILDYSNPLYDQGLSPASDAGRAAFARWAAAAATHFRNRGVLWEMYNEPNIGFWKPKPDVAQYVRLALAVGQALRAAEPHAQYVGPATSQIDLDFLEACFRGGLLQYWDAVSVHPYRQSGPETAAAEYARLRQLIRRYAPPGKNIPILSGEWGYASVWHNYDEVRQGKFLPRQWLTNLSHGVPLSIWYDWHDDGVNPSDPEHHFGTTAHAYHAGRNPVYDPKPAYLAAATLTRILSGYTFNKRLDLGGEEDYALLFANTAGEVRCAAWSASPTPHAVLIPASAGRFRAIGHTGEELPPVTADASGLRITLTDAVTYLVPQDSNVLWNAAAAWSCVPLELTAHAPARVTCTTTFRNPLAHTVRVQAIAGAGVEVEPDRPLDLTAGERVSVRYSRLVARGEIPTPLLCSLDVARFGRVTQRVPLAIDNPLRVTPLPAMGRSLPLAIDNPLGEAFHGSLSLAETQGLTAAGTVDVQLDAGQSQKQVLVPLQQPAAAHYEFAVRLQEAAAAQTVVPVTRFTAIDDFARYTPETLGQAYRLNPEGDAKVHSEQALAGGIPPEGPPAPGAGCLKIDYRFEKGWKYLCLMPNKPAGATLAGHPRALGLWIHGDGSGNALRLRVVDATGQTLQPNGESMRWTGWRYVEFPLDGSHAGHWGGANDGVVHLPLRWNALLLIDSSKREPTAGTIYVSAPTLME